jgi:hypothetical protein
MVIGKSSATKAQKTLIVKPYQKEKKKVVDTAYFTLKIRHPS